MEQLKNFSELVSKRRREMNLTLADLSSRSNVSVRILVSIENNKHKITHKRGRTEFAKIVKKLAEALGFDQAEWREKLKLPEVSLNRRDMGFMGMAFSLEDLQYLVKVAEGLTEPLPLATALDLISLRKK